MKRIRHALLALIIACAASTGFSPSAAARSQAGGELIISVGTGAPKTMNSATASGYTHGMVSSQIFASPLRYDEDWNPLPYLAQSWNVSEDGRTVTLHLVEGATFHDGRDITSADVAFSVKTVKQHSPFKDALALVERVDTPDVHTAVLQLEKPHPAILMTLSPLIMPILPEHVYGDGQDIRTHPANMKPVGSGPFRFVSYTPGEQLVLERHKQFFLPGRPRLDRLVFSIQGDVDAQMLDAERQESHVLPFFINPGGLNRLEKSPRLALTDRGYAGIGAINWLEFNLLKKPLDDKRVRQAIAYAADREFITKFLHRGKSRIATGPITPDSPFYESSVPRYKIDLTRAKALLEEAGLPIKADGTRFSLTLDYPFPVPSQLEDVALHLKEQLAKIGIRVKTQKWDTFKGWIDRVAHWEFDMTMDILSNYADPVIGVQRTYLSRNIRKGVMFTNTSNYRNTRVDDLLTRAGLEMDPDKRKSLYSQFQKVVTEELPILWINVVPFHTVYHSGLAGLPVSIWGLHSPLDELHWKTPPETGNVAPPTLEDGSSVLKQTGIRAIKLIQERGLYPSLKALKDPGQGFLDLKGSGRHVIGFTNKGLVFMDNSNRFKAGMDISGILDLKGEPLLPKLLDAAKIETGGLFQSTGALPHPHLQLLTEGDAGGPFSKLATGSVLQLLGQNGVPSVNADLRSRGRFGRRDDGGQPFQLLSGSNR